MTTPDAAELVRLCDEAIETQRLADEYKIVNHSIEKAGIMARALKSRLEPVRLTAEQREDEIFAELMRRFSNKLTMEDTRKLAIALATLTGTESGLSKLQEMADRLLKDTAASGKGEAAEYRGSVEALAEAWSSIDGHLEAFQRERAQVEHPVFGGSNAGRGEGRYGGYIAEAEEMIERLWARGYGILNVTQGPANEPWATIPVNSPGPCKHGKPWLAGCPECRAESKWRSKDPNHPDNIPQGPAPKPSDAKPFDGTIHPDGTPNQVTPSDWIAGEPKPSDDKGVVGEIAKRHAAGRRGWSGHFDQDYKIMCELHDDRATLLALHNPLAERREGLRSCVAQARFEWREQSEHTITESEYIADALIAWLEGGKP